MMLSRSAILPDFEDCGNRSREGICMIAPAASTGPAMVDYAPGKHRIVREKSLRFSHLLSIRLTKG